MANPNKMGMSERELRKSRAARFPNPTFPSNPDFQKVLNDLQAGKIDAQEAERRIREVTKQS